MERSILLSQHWDLQKRRNDVTRKLSSQAATSLDLSSSFHSEGADGEKLIDKGRLNLSKNLKL